MSVSQEKTTCPLMFVSSIKKRDKEEYTQLLKQSYPNKQADTPWQTHQFLWQHLGGAQC